MSEESLAAHDVRRLFTYDAASGKLFWKERPDEDFPDERAAKIWNTRFVGKAAGYVNNQNNRRVIRILLNGISSNYLAYRLIWAFHTGVWPGDTIDHIDGDQSNDRFENLRDVPFSENCKNLAIAANNRTGILGVNWDENRGCWQARIQVQKKQIWLGYFDNIDDAKTARKSAEKLYGFHPNHGRSAKRAPSNLFGDAA